jgi:hypothetical protein
MKIRNQEKKQCLLKLYRTNETKFKATINIQKNRINIIKKHLTT